MENKIKTRNIMNLSGNKYCVVMTDTKESPATINQYAIAGEHMLTPEFDFMAYVMDKIRQYAETNPTDSVAIYATMSSFRKLLHLGEYWQHICERIKTYKGIHPDHTHVQLVDEDHLSDSERFDIIYNY